MSFSTPPTLPPSPNLTSPVLFQEKYGLGEPSDEMVEAIYRDMPKEVTRVIAVGGGGVLDIAKLLVLQHVPPILNLYDGKLPKGKGRDLVLVPTTCGTGSEVTNISILALLSRRTKKGLAHESMFADQAVLIPELLKGLPFSVFATSSIDALIHAIESSLSPKASTTAELLGYQATASILKGYLAIRTRGPRRPLAPAVPVPPGHPVRRHRLRQRRLRRGPRPELPLPAPSITSPMGSPTTPCSPAS
ncbi:MAG: iron-containing alcohol dehydrogenase [Evtepia gabavorous]